MAGHKTTHTQLQRYQIIDRLLASNICPSFDYILNYLRAELNDENLSDSTVHRDLKYMEEFLAAPIIYDRGKNGYLYSEPYYLPVNNFTKYELQLLIFIKKIFGQYSESNNVFKRCLELLEKFFPGLKDNIIEERIHIAENPQPVLEKNLCEQIFLALSKNCCIDFVYRSKWEPGKNHRIVKPCQVIFDKGQFYLYAADINDDSKIRLYSFSRIYELTILENKHFKLPENYKFREEFEQGRFGAFQYDEAYDFKIEIYGESRNQLHEFVWADNQILDEVPGLNKTIISFSSSQWIPIQQWLLSFGSNAKPLEPDWLVDWWKEEIQKMFKNISK